MNLTGKANLFVKENDGKDNTKYKTFSLSISRKEKNGSYTNASLEAQLVGDKFKKETIDKLDPSKCYTIDVTDAFLSFRTYTTEVNKKTLNHVVWQAIIRDAKVEKVIDIKKDENTPF